MTPWNDLLSHHAFPELSRTIRSHIESISGMWEQAMRQSRAEWDQRSSEELRDSIAQILRAMADALDSSNPEDIRHLVERSPGHGIDRFDQQQDLLHMMDEDRLLRGIIVQQIEEGLGRQLQVPEAASLHATIDIMLQQSVLAMVEKQKEELRRAAELELKYLSFLSHDLNNNLNGISASLELLDQSLSGRPEFREELETVDLARKTIANTVGGMRRLLQHERMRKGGAEPTRGPVRLHDLVNELAERFAPEAAKKGLKIAVEVNPQDTINTDSELIALVLQNLMNNAIKYSSKGTVRIAASHDPRDSKWILSVSDEGPGISQQQQTELFRAFRRGITFGQPGVGLGLAIAFQAATLLGGEVAVNSHLGKGSTFSLILPAPNRPS